MKTKLYIADIYFNVITIRVMARNKRQAKKKVVSRLRKRNAARLVDWSHTDLETYL